MSLPLYAKNFMVMVEATTPFNQKRSQSKNMSGPVENQGYTYTLEDDPSHTSFDVPVWIRIANRRQI